MFQWARTLILNFRVGGLWGLYMCGHFAPTDKYPLVDWTISSYSTIQLFRRINKHSNRKGSVKARTFHWIKWVITMASYLISPVAVSIATEPRGAARSGEINSVPMQYANILQNYLYTKLTSITNVVYSVPA